LAQRRKPADKRADTQIHIRVTAGLKARLDRMADATSIAISETARTCLLAVVEAWEQDNPLPASELDPPSA
jgi:hypothetical protein